MLLVPLHPFAVAVADPGVGLVTNLFVLEERAGEVRAASYLTVLDRAGSPPRVVATGAYDDLIVRDHGVLRFRRRRLTVDPSFKP